METLKTAELLAVLARRLDRCLDVVENNLETISAGQPAEYPILTAWTVEDTAEAIGMARAIMQTIDHLGPDLMPRGYDRRYKDIWYRSQSVIHAYISATVTA